MNQSKALGYAIAKADKFLEETPQDPQAAHDMLTKLIIDAMITEGAAIRKVMCPKCADAYFRARYQKEGR